MSDNLKLPKDHSDRADWWFVDQTGRKIGYMWPEDILSIIDSIWGHKQGIKNFSRYAGLSRTTVEKYCNGGMPVPKTIAMLVSNMQEVMLVKQARRTSHPWRTLPTIDPVWLPENRQEEKFTIAKLPFG